MGKRSPSYDANDQWHFWISLLLFLSLLSFCFFPFLFWLFAFDKREQTEIGGMRGGGSGIAERIPVQPNPGGSRGEGGGEE